MAKSSSNGKSAGAKKPRTQTKASVKTEQKATSGRKTIPKRELRTDSGLSEKMIKEIRSIIFIFVCFMLAMSYYTPFFGIVGKFVRSLGLLLFGNVAYVAPVLALAAALHMIFKNSLHPHVHRYVAALAICLCASALLTVQLYSANPSYFGNGYSEAEWARAIKADPALPMHTNLTLGDVLANVVSSAREGRGGGLVGYLVSIPFIRLVTPVGTTLIFWALILVFVVVMTGTTPFVKLAEYIDRRIAAGREEPAPQKPARDFAEPEPMEFIADKPEPRRRTRAASKKEDPQTFWGRVRDKLFNNGADAVKTPAKKKKKRPRPETAQEGTRKIKPQVVSPNRAADEEIKIKLFDAQPGGEEVPDEIAAMAKAESGAVEAAAKAEKPKAEPAIPVNDDEIDTDFIPYEFPPVKLLGRDKPSKENTTEADVRQMGQKLVDTLRSFGVEAKIIEIIRGPAITRFELSPAAGVKVNKIVNLANDIALNLAAVSVRVIAPIPGKAAVGIEVPNENVATVRLRDVIDTDEFRNFKGKTAFALGKDVSGKVRIADISKMPHLLIAGATGSGKSVCINSLITSIIYKADPNEVKLIMIDPKVVELQVYNGIPHLLIPVVTDPRRAAGALNWAVQEMVKRYKLFAENNVRNLAGYNELAQVNGDRKLEQIIIIVDELADLMMVSAKEVEDSICRLAQMARAAGMYLVIATQRPSVDVITGLIKANVPSRIAFAVSNQIDSRTILDMGGAEKLLGRGDMLFLPMGANSPIRIQGAFVSDAETEAIVEYIKQDFSAKYDEDIMEHIERGAEGGQDQREEDSGDADEMLPAAIQAVVEAGQASASLLQRRLKVGYARAGRLIDQLEERGIIGPHEGSKPRAVLMSRSEYLEMQAMGDGE